MDDIPLPSSDDSPGPPGEENVKRERKHSTFQILEKCAYLPIYSSRNSRLHSFSLLTHSVLEWIRLKAGTHTRDCNSLQTTKYIGSKSAII